MFDLEVQTHSLDAKIVVALERVSEVFRVSLWHATKEHGLSPLQIQILIFLLFHTKEQCKVSYLAQEFNLSKPTISEAIRTLSKKNLILKEKDLADTRSYTIHLSDSGKEIARQVAFFANDLPKAMTSWTETRKTRFYRDLLQLIYQLQQLGFIQVQRSCLKCRFLQEGPKGYRCQLLDLPLKQQDLRIDCPEFEAGSSE